MKYMLIEYIDAGFRSGEEVHRFNTIDEALEYIKNSRMPIDRFKLYETKEIDLRR